MLGVAQSLPLRTVCHIQSRKFFLDGLVLNIGLSELLIVGVAGLVFIGPERLPDVMRFLGRAYAKVRFASKDLRMAFQQEVDKVETDRRMIEIARRREALRLRREQEEGDLTNTGARASDPHSPAIQPEQDSTEGEE
jgi:sec-independent protein translocase protein TatB